MAGKIFINYRREDTAGFAQALFGRLEQSFSAKSLFMDVDSIGAGQDFVRAIEEQVGECDAMLVLIGPKWLNVTDETGGRRLENPQDFVRIEVDSALRFGKRVIPVLVQKTAMPRADALPEPLKALALLNAVGLTNERFKADAQGLCRALEATLAEVKEARRQAEIPAKAEELANWAFIKNSQLIEDFRDHLARFPFGMSQPWARSRLEGLVWAALPRPLSKLDLEGFLAEFPNGTHSSEMIAKLVKR
jgi:hypothetical protein